MDTVVQGLQRALALLFSFDREFYSIVFLSLKVSGAGVVIASALGVPLGAACALRSFPGRALLVTVLNTLMGLPPVVAGLVVYLLLSRSGPLGFMGLLYSPAAMVIAQSAIAAPIVAALTWSAVASVDKSVESFDVQVPCEGGAPVSGYFARPVGAKPKSLPAILHVHGAGVGSSSLSAAMGSARTVLPRLARTCRKGRPARSARRSASTMAPPWFMSRQNLIQGSAYQKSCRLEPYKMSFHKVHSGRVYGRF